MDDLKKRVSLLENEVEQLKNRNKQVDARRETDVVKLQEDKELIEQEISEIRERNNRVERDKSWETSLTRKIAIAGVTYIVVALVFWIIKVDRPFVNAIIPAIAFTISTLSMPWFKRYWLNLKQ